MCRLLIIFQRNTIYRLHMNKLFYRSSHLEFQDQTIDLINICFLMINYKLSITLVRILFKPKFVFINY